MRAVCLVGNSSSNGKSSGMDINSYDIIYVVKRGNRNKKTAFFSYGVNIIKKNKDTDMFDEQDLVGIDNIKDNKVTENILVTNSVFQTKRMYLSWSCRLVEYILYGFDINLKLRKADGKNNFDYLANSTKTGRIRTIWSVKTRWVNNLDTADKMTKLLVYLGHEAGDLLNWYANGEDAKIAYSFDVLPEEDVLDSRRIINDAYEEYRWDRLLNIVKSLKTKESTTEEKVVAMYLLYNYLNPYEDTEKMTETFKSYIADELEGINIDDLIQELKESFRKEYEKYSLSEYIGVNADYIYGRLDEISGIDPLEVKNIKLPKENREIAGNITEADRVSNGVDVSNLECDKRNIDNTLNKTMVSCENSNTAIENLEGENRSSVATIRTQAETKYIQSGREDGNLDTIGKQAETEGKQAETKYIQRGKDEDKLGTEYIQRGRDENKLDTISKQVDTEYIQSGRDADKLGTVSKQVDTEYNQGGRDEDKLGTECNQGDTEYIQSDIEDNQDGTVGKQGDTEYHLGCYNSDEADTEYNQSDTKYNQSDIEDNQDGTKYNLRDIENSQDGTENVLGCYNSDEADTEWLLGEDKDKIKEEIGDEDKGYYKSEDSYLDEVDDSEDGWVYSYIDEEAKLNEDDIIDESELHSIFGDRQEVNEEAEESEESNQKSQLESLLELNRLKVKQEEEEKLKREHNLFKDAFTNESLDIEEFKPHEEDSLLDVSGANINIEADTPGERSCPICKGTGVAIAKGLGIPIICECVERKRKRLLAREEKVNRINIDIPTEIDDICADENLIIPSRIHDTFSISTAIINLNEYMNNNELIMNKDSLKLVKAAINSITRDSNGTKRLQNSIMINLPNGVGKTTLANTCIKSLRARGKRVVPYRSLTEIARLREEYSLRLLYHTKSTNFEDDFLGFRYKWEDYLTAETVYCFLVEIDKMSAQLELSTLKTLVTIRGNNGLPTVVFTDRGILAYEKNDTLSKFVLPDLIAKEPKQAALDMPWYITLKTKKKVGLGLQPGKDI